MKERFLRFNRGFAKVLLWILTPPLLILLWLGIGLTCVLPRLFAVELLPSARMGEGSHWRDVSTPDTSTRGMRRQG